MRKIIELWNRLFDWSLLDDWRTWAGHSLLACVMALGVAVLYCWAIPWVDALQAGVTFAMTVYLTREVLEMSGHLPTVRRKIHDHFLDVAAPALALNVLYRLCV